MRHRSFTLAALVALVLAIGFSGCTRPVRPTVPPTDEFTALPSATPAPPTATLLVETPSLGELAQVAPELTTPVPILYKMFDYGTDFQTQNPELGPIGSIQWYDWERINPGRGAFNWAPIDSRLALEAKLKVTLPDGTEIPKPVVIQIMATTSGSTGKHSYTDHTPTWVYDIIDAQNPDDPRPVVGGRKVGHRLVGCDTEAVLPMYDSPTWRDYHYEMVRAFGDRYNNHPQVTAIVVNTGLDGETQPMKDLHCPWNTHLDQQAGDVRYNFVKFMQEVMAVYREAFPNKTIYVNNAPGGSGTRKMTSDLAASFDPPIGLKHSGMWVDLDSHQGHGEFYGSWDMIRAYSTTLPIWLESPFGLGSAEHRYWSLIAGLHYHPDAIDCHPEYFTQSDPEWLRFVVSHLGVTLQDTPDVWTVLRDSEFPLVSWGKAGVSGHMGDWAFWLYRSDSAPQSDTQVVLREDMPAAQDHIYSRQARRTIQDDNHTFMSFDVDDGYPYVAQKPIDLDGGTVYYRVHVTLLNQGDDTFSLQYRNWEGGIVKQMLQKGPHLGPVDDWVTVSFLVRDGYLNNNMPGDVDLRISCERDGDEYIHMIRVEGGWGVPPAPTETPLPTSTGPPTPTGAATAAPPGSGDPAATSAAPTPPTSLGPTPTRIPNALELAPSADTYIDEWAPSTTNQDDPVLLVRLGDIQAPLMRFDLDGIPPDATVDKAILSFAVGERSNTGILKVAVHRLLRPWDEAVCTWQRATAREGWGLPGCKDVVKDLAGNLSAEVWLENTRTWYDLDLTQVVQDWVVAPHANHGLIFKTGGTTYVQYQIYASEALDPNARPRLQVVLRDGPGIPIVDPEPSLMPPSTPSGLGTDAPPGLDQPRTTGTPFASLPPSPSPTLIPAPTTVIFREGVGYEGTADTFLDAWAQDANYGASRTLAARQGGVRIPLLRFDVTSIPEHASVRSSTLHLYAVERSNPAPLALGLARVNRPWDAQAASWLQRTEIDQWSLPGAADAGQDRSSHYYATGTLEAVRTWTHWDVNALVQEWVSDPAHNYGLLLLARGDTSVQYDLASSEWAISDYRPYLEVSYVPAQPSPTPQASLVPNPTLTPTRDPIPAGTPFPPKGEALFQQGQDGYAACEDTFVDAWSPRENHAAAGRLLVSQGDIRSALLRFDLTRVPSSSHVLSARLELYAAKRNGPHPLDLRLHGIRRPWDIEQVTFERASSTLPWHEPGLGSPLRDLLGAEPAAQARATDAGEWVEFQISELVQHWVTFPELNLGMVIKGEGSVAVEYELASSDWLDDPNLRPRLSVAWEPAPPMPTVTGTPSTPTHTATASATTTATPTLTPTRQAAKLVLQQGLAGYEGARDTFLDAWNQDVPMGGRSTLDIRQPGTSVGLVSYDLGAIPRDAQVTQARLFLWSPTGSSSGEAQLGIYRLMRPWSEAQATWLQPDASTVWAGPGASQTGDDANADRQAQATGEVVFSEVSQWVMLDVTQDVERWLQHSEENLGWLISGEGTASFQYLYASSQWPEVEQRPKLIITYEAAPGGGGSPAKKLSVLQWLGLILGPVALLYLLLRGGKAAMARRARRRIVR